MLRQCETFIQAIVRTLQVTTIITTRLSDLNNDIRILFTLFGKQVKKQSAKFKKHQLVIAAISLAALTVSLCIIGTVDGVAALVGVLFILTLGMLYNKRGEISYEN